MGQTRGLLLPAILSLLVFLPFVLAHGHDSPGSEEASVGAPSTLLTSINTTNPKIPSYFAHPQHVVLIIAHIALMTVAWFFILPIGQPTASNNENGFGLTQTRCHA